MLPNQFQMALLQNWSEGQYADIAGTPPSEIRGHVDAEASADFIRLYDELVHASSWEKAFRIIAEQLPFQDLTRAATKGQQGK